MEKTTGSRRILPLHSKDELENMRVMDIDPIFPAEQWPGHWKELEERGTVSVESVHERKDGHRFPVEIVANFIEYQDRHLNFAFSRDISERKQAEELASLREQLVKQMHRGDLDQLMQAALDAAERMTDSRIGFFHFLEEDQETLSLQTWSTRTLREVIRYVESEQVTELRALDQTQCQTRPLVPRSRPGPLRRPPGLRLPAAEAHRGARTGVRTRQPGGCRLERAGATPARS